MQLKKDHGGFTLIELLVVIAIIGILSTIVLVSVNTARNKAKDAAIKGSLEQGRVAAELWYDSQSPTAYTGFCASTDETRIETAVTGQGGTYVCNAIANAFCMQSTLVAGGSFCVDSTGYAGSTANCDAVNANCAL